jgi:hemerythrin superfamily protein
MFYEDYEKDQAYKQLELIEKIKYYKNTGYKYADTIKFIGIETLFNFSLQEKLIDIYYSDNRSMKSQMKRQMKENLRKVMRTNIDISAMYKEMREGFLKIA